MYYYLQNILHPFMVNNFPEVFKKYFEQYHDNYVIIGGTAFECIKRTN